MDVRLAGLQNVTRRHFLQGAGLNVGAIALASLMDGPSGAAPVEVANPLAPRQPHFPAKAKRVIYLHMTGSPPHLLSLIHI